ncbi:hypothetical protein [Pengzhenrongella phosphoraccumulans]|uniref:hypothetical protein n=1 Tax=Pengzhenrongella phosphoraccumulans TaxID=3114394 RepID=UPI00388ECA84
MAQIQASASASERALTLTAGVEVTAGRSDSADLIIGTSEWLSRHAVSIRQLTSGRVQLRSTQTTGIVLVLRPDGTEFAHLRPGEGVMCGRGRYVVEVHNPRPVGTFLVVDDDPGVAPRSRHPDRDEQVTVGRWPSADVLDPGPKDEWRTIAAMCVVAVGRDLRSVATTSGANTRVKGYAGLWFDRIVTAGWLSTRLDRSVEMLGIKLANDSEKVPAIARWMVDSRPVDPQVYALIRERLKSLDVSRIRRA